MSELDLMLEVRDRLKRIEILKAQILTELELVNRRLENLTVLCDAEHAR